LLSSAGAVKDAARRPGGCLWQSLTAPTLDSLVIGRSGRRDGPDSVEPRDA
jgi:hypothetical protein